MAGRLLWTSPHDVAELFYTSGTTGSPKGVVISHRSLRIAADGVVKVLGLDEIGVRSLIAVPLFHVMGANNHRVRLRDLRLPSRTLPWVPGTA